MKRFRLYLGLAIVTAATIFAEITLTRILSVILWYHFAFVAISLAMLGMAGGAMYVYLHRDRFPAERSLQAMGEVTFWFGLALVGAYVLTLGVGVRLSTEPAALVALLMLIALWGVPFFLSGVVVSIALTRTELPVGRLYAADLGGAALGVLLIQPALSALGPPGSLGIVAIVLGLAALMMIGSPARALVAQPWRGWALAGLAAFTVFAAVKPEAISPKWIKGEWEARAEVVRWNSYSRIALFPPKAAPPHGWGFSRQLDREALRVTSRFENIDAGAGTWITQFDGDIADHGYLAWDVTNMPYHLRDSGSVAVIGVGGGRDLLSARLLGDFQVTGIELNEILVDLLSDEYAAFSGNLARDPRTTLVVGEARNWLERSDRQFDVIQISLIDTWAASATGAFALTENTLYTADAWESFLKHLRSDGLLSVSRWRNDRYTAEVYRLTTVARAALLGHGQGAPGRCVAVVADAAEDGEVATVLVSPSPLSALTLQELRATAERYGFAVLYAPDQPAEPFATLLDPQAGPAWEARHDLDVSPPTDDRPFFFQVLRLRDVFHPSRWGRGVPDFGGEVMHASAIGILGVLGVALLTGATLLTVRPLHARAGGGVWRRDDWAMALYFAAIGIAFMMLEMAMIQRAGIMLGHPVLGLQVVLFALLAGSGLGSLISSGLRGAPATRARLLLLGAVVVTAGTVLALSPVAESLAASPQAARIAVVAALVAVAGVLMGMPFPNGLAVARAAGRDDLLPWLWGVNGITSVLGTYLGTVTTLFAGARISGLVGVACYVAALLAVTWYTTRPSSDREGS